VTHVLRRIEAVEAVTAKNRGISRWDRQRELLDLPREADAERRCRVTPQARRVGFA
jgi:hypothetical protein